MTTSEKTHRCRGIACIWTAILGLVLIGFVGLAIDVSHAKLAGNELQNAADAAALGGAQLVRETYAEARSLAVSTAAANAVRNTPIEIARNDGNSPDGDVVTGRYDRASRTFVPGNYASNAVKVVARRTSDSLLGRLPLLFGPIFGVDSIDISRSATAMIGGTSGAGLIVLDSSEQAALDIRGDVELRVDGGAIQVNSDAAIALDTRGGPSIETPNLNVVGGADLGNATLTGDLSTGADFMPDPLAMLPPPPFDPMNDLDAVNISSASQHQQLRPGYYSGGIHMNTGSLTLDPGIYVLDGVGLDIVGGDFIAEGVMLYVIDSTPTNKKESHVYLGGNGATRISGIDPERFDYPPGVEIYEQVSIFQARDNTNDATIIGTGLMDLEGTYYFPSNHTTISGTSDNVGNQFITNTIQLVGTGELTINYNDGLRAPGFSVFLVE